MQELSDKTDELLDKAIQACSNKFSLSKIHTLVKIGICLGASISTIILDTPQGLGTLFIFSLIYALFLPRRKILVYACIFATLMFCIAAFLGYLLTLVLPIRFDGAGIFAPFLRMLIMLNTILPLAFSTSIQSILTSLKSLHIPFILYLPAAVIIRFIPTFLYDIKQVSETLKIRGYVINVGEAIRHPFTMMRLLFAPLLFRSLRTSDDLGIAGELKAMHADIEISQYKKEVWKKSDKIILWLAIFAVFLSIIAQFTAGTDFPTPDLTELVGGQPND